MNKFDRKIRKLTKKIEVPASYDEKVDQVLLDIMKKGELIPEKRKNYQLVFRLAVCLLCIFGVLSLYTINAEANFFSFFKETIMDFLGRGNSGEDITGMGVESEKLSVSSKLDLMMELQETVIDSHSIYVLVKITAPPNIRFDENTLFDYFCFCKGSNYSVNQLLGGSLSCELLEVSKEYPNIATYVVSLVFDEVLEEGSEVTVCFEDLTKDPCSSSPELLIDGVWSLSFYYYLTVTDHIELEGTPDMVFPFINTTAELIKLELSPFGIVVYADVSNFPRDELGISDTNIAIRLKMIDGSELTVVSHDPEKQEHIQGGSVSFIDEGEKTYEQVNLEFTNMVNIGKVVGIY
ncbi:MAG: hypothetical protein K2H91_12285, partial [Lachnospiraceae bacterium]|nr:hypothetical protein [Lachnospiraceae bacterium]